MAKTDLGCRVLNDKGHFAEFAQFIRKHGMETEDQEIILKLKSALWTVVSRLSVYMKRTDCRFGKGEYWFH